MSPAAGTSAGAEDAVVAPADGIAAPSHHAPRQRRRRTRGALAIEWGVVLVLAALLAIGLRSFAFEVFSVPSGSMIPTIEIGDRILVDKAFFNYHDLKEGQIIVFQRPPRDVLGTCAGPEVGDLVKRVIGLPGQTISSSGNTVLINGKPLAEPYLPPNTELGRPIQPPVHIPKDRFFVLGDNRALSCDSRYWGTISGSSIVGRVVATIWHNGHPDLHIF